MNAFQSSPSVLNKIQWVTAMGSLLGLFYFKFTTPNILLTILFFYAYSIVGISMTLHRYYTHKSFKLNAFWKWFCTLFAILAGRGSVLGWVYVHRVHHAYADEEKDPHSPWNMGFKLFGFKPAMDEKLNVFLIKDLMNAKQLFINKWYVLILVGWLSLLTLINPSLAYFTWVLPVFLIHFSQNCFNYFGHMYGHRNFETSDKSTNNVFLWPLIWGDAWHNNHHAKPREVSTKLRWWELDPTSVIINLIRKDVQR